MLAGASLAAGAGVSVRVGGRGHGEDGRAGGERRGHARRAARVLVYLCLQITDLLTHLRGLLIREVPHRPTDRAGDPIADGASRYAAALLAGVPIWGRRLFGAPSRLISVRPSCTHW